MLQEMNPSGPTIFYHDAGGEVTETTDLDVLRRGLENGKSVTWLDLHLKSDADATVLSEVFGFHPLSIEDAMSHRVDPAKIDDHDTYIFIVTQSLGPYDPDAELESVEVDFYLGPNYVVSTHREVIPSIDAFREQCRRNAVLLSRGADWILHGLLDALVDEYLPVVDAVDETLDSLEEDILEQPDTRHLQRVLLVKRNAMRLRRASTPQREIMNRLSRGEFPKLIREDHQIYFRDIYDHLVRIEYLVEGLRDLADGALNTYLSVVSNRLNEVMKVLTAAATVFLPLTLISGIYGMNFAENQFPGFDDAWGFAAVVGAMITIAIGLLAYFRYRRWV
jgi:magnesium transporter